MGISLQQYRVVIGCFVSFRSNTDNEGVGCGCKTRKSGVQTSDRKHTCLECGFDTKLGSVYSVCRYYASVWYMQLFMYNTYKSTILAQSNDIEKKTWPLFCKYKSV